RATEGGRDLSRVTGLHEVIGVHSRSGGSQPVPREILGSRTSLAVDNLAIPVAADIVVGEDRAGSAATGRALFTEEDATGPVVRDFARRGPQVGGFLHQMEAGAVVGDHVVADRRSVRAIGEDPVAVACDEVVANESTRYAIDRDAFIVESPVPVSGVVPVA